MLVKRLAAVGDAVLDVVAVPADVEDRRGLGRRRLWDVEVGRDVEAGHRLEDKFLHCEFGSFELAGDSRIQVRAWRHRPEAEHLQKLSPEFGLRLLPVFLGFDVAQGSVADFLGLTLKVHLDHPFTRKRWRTFW